MQLSLLGWNDQFAAAFAAHASAGIIPGRVIQQFNHIFTVATETGEQSAQLSGRLRHDAASHQLPVTGDWVALRVPPNQGVAQIIAVLPRATRFSRRAAGKGDREQVIAANLDYAFLVSGLDNDFSPRRIERYLTATWDSGATPVVVLNKLDLCGDPESRIHAVEQVAFGTAIHAVSALRGDGVDELARYCQPGRTVALLGSSGVGKSTLINRVMGTESQDTQPLREDGRGRHTTTRRELLFCKHGGMVIDTPGMRELRLWDDDEGLQITFDEIETIARNCRYRDCRHEEEPGCAVLEAVSAGTLSPERLSSLHKLQRELAFLERREDETAESAEKRRWKNIHKSVRRFMNESPKYK
ncbi:MAG TPA: ribosome small subunit-dependent GTPase A [Terriglobales bacterium]|nr:ribosome small subunit-dependent GTPase A [Terriglobales bacterium]